jgi:hypothetical protein
MRGEHTVKPTAMPRRGGTKAASRSRNWGARESTVAPAALVRGLSRPLDHLLSMPTPNVASWAHQTGPRPGPGSSPSRSRASMRTAASSEKLPPCLHWRMLGRGLGREQPRAEPRRGSNTIQRCFIRSSHWLPPSRIPNYQRCWTPVAAPPPVTLRLDTLSGLYRCFENASGGKSLRVSLKSSERAMQGACRPRIAQST